MCEHDVVGMMKEKFNFVKNLCGCCITSIIDPAIKVATQILARKVKRKFHTNKVSTLVVSFSTWFAEDVQFNWACYMCSKFLMNYREA